jgi:hypothetical protein
VEPHSLLINKLRKVYQVGVDSLMYRDVRSTKHQAYETFFKVTSFNNTVSNIDAH